MKARQSYSPRFASFLAMQHGQLLHKTECHCAIRSEAVAPSLLSCVKIPWVGMILAAAIGLASPAGADVKDYRFTVDTADAVHDAAMATIENPEADSAARHAAYELMYADADQVGFYTDRLGKIALTESREVLGSRAIEVLGEGRSPRAWHYFRAKLAMLDRNTLESAYLLGYIDVYARARMLARGYAFARREMIDTAMTYLDPNTITNDETRGWALELIGNIAFNTETDVIAKLNAMQPLDPVWASDYTSQLAKIAARSPVTLQWTELPQQPSADTLRMAVRHSQLYVADLRPIAIKDMAISGVFSNKDDSLDYALLDSIDQTTPVEPAVVSAIHAAKPIIYNRLQTTSVIRSFRPKIKSRLRKGTIGNRINVEFVLDKNAEIMMLNANGQTIKALP